MSIDNIISDLLEKVQGEEGAFPYMANKREFVAGESPVYYSGPYWDNDEIEVILKSFLKGKWLASGEEVNKFEKKFSKKSFKVHVFGFWSTIARELKPKDVSIEVYL